MELITGLVLSRSRRFENLMKAKEKYMGHGYKVYKCAWKSLYTGAEEFMCLQE